MSIQTWIQDTFGPIIKDAVKEAVTAAIDETFKDLRVDLASEFDGVESAISRVEGLFEPLEQKVLDNISNVTQQVSSIPQQIIGAIQNILPHFPGL